MPKPKMIVIWDGEDILGSFVTLFLAAREDWAVVNIANKEDLDALILAAGSTPADIVIIYQRCHTDPPNLPLELLHDHPAIKVITLSLENNTMDVYSKQKIMVQQASDLIAVIENEP